MELLIIRLVFVDFRCVVFIDSLGFSLVFWFLVLAVIGVCEEADCWRKDSFLFGEIS